MSHQEDDTTIYAKGIGAILGNFQALEYTIRTFLLEVESAGRGISFTPVNLHIGNHVPINAFTNHDTLARLISKYNRRVKAKYPTLRVDPSIVDLRNAIVHGRAASHQRGFPMLLLNFGPPHNKQVEVIKAEKINKSWLTNQINRVFLELRKIMKAGQSMGMKYFPNVQESGPVLGPRGERLKIKEPE